MSQRALGHGWDSWDVWDTADSWDAGTLGTRRTPWTLLGAEKGRPFGQPFNPRRKTMSYEEGTVNTE